MANKITFKEDGLSGLPTAPEGTVYLGYNGTTFSQRSQTDISQVGSLSSGTKDCGEIYQSPTNLTETQSESILVSFKIPANTYQVGDMMTIGPSVLVWGRYDASFRSNPGPITNVDGYREVQYYDTPVGYYNSTFTFSQSSTSGSGSGLVIDITYDGVGQISSYSVIDGGNGYVFGEIITLEDKGFGNPEIEVFNDYDDPNAIVRSYWSYSNEGLDNFCEQISLDYYAAGWRHIFNTATPSTSGNSGWLPSFSKIINNTTIKYIQEQQQTQPYQFIIGSCSIPDITQDIYFTITGELEDINTSLSISFIKALDDMKTDEFYLISGYSNNPFDTNETITNYVS